MCGLVGMAGTITAEHEKVFRDLLIIDSLRGNDSVGVASIGVGSYSIHKKAMIPTDFMETKGFKDIMASISNILIGHNRFATKGKVSNINAHPFECGDTIGAHNGTLINTHSLPDHDKFEVDSEMMLHTFDKLGIEEGYKLINGAVATTFYNKKNKTLHLLRNKERPLHFTYSKDRKVIMWASEAWMLHGALVRNKMEYTEILSVAEDTLYTLKMDSFNRDTPLDKLSIKKLSGYESDYHHYRTPIKYGKEVTKNTVVSLGYRGMNVKKLYPIGSTISLEYVGGLIDKRFRSIDAQVFGNEKIKVRIFTKGISSVLLKQIESSAENDGVFTGRVNGYTSDGVILIQSNSLKMEPINSKSKDVDDNYIEFDGVLINKATFRLIPEAQKTCSWCASPLQFESGHIVINRSTAICKDCVDIPEVVELFDQIKGAYNG